MSELDESISDIAVETGIIEDTIQQDLSLKIVSKSKSNSKVWNYFGHLLFKQVLISRVSNKVYCKICFDTGHLKRYTKIFDDLT